MIIWLLSILYSISRNNLILSFIFVFSIIECFCYKCWHSNISRCFNHINTYRNNKLNLLNWISPLRHSAVSVKLRRARRSFTETAECLVERWDLPTPHEAKKWRGKNRKVVLIFVCIHVSNEHQHTSFLLKIKMNFFLDPRLWKFV